ncbi:MAG: arylsulfatase [bacterium]|nr:arylsulfatase [bacterium]
MKGSALAAALSLAGVLTAAQKPNIVLIYTDDQGYGDASALNPEAKFQTPNIDRLAAEGLTFTDGHAPDTVCTPSRYGLLTGRYSWRTRLKKGVMGAEGECLIADGRVTLASLLAEHGYNTAMVGKWHLGMQFAGAKGRRDWDAPVRDGPVAKGFGYFFGIPASMNYGILTYIENDRVTAPATLWTRKKPNRIAIDDYRIAPPYSEDPAGYNLEVAANFVDAEALTVFTRKALDWIDKTPKDAPFFLYLSYTSPHKPVIPIERFRGKSKAGAYGDFVTETDHHVGRILDALDHHELANDTLVIFTSDNGPENTYRKRTRMYNHRSAGELRGGKRDLYEGGHRVPFLVRWPAHIKAGRVSDEPVCQTDLLATVADILEADLPEGAAEDSFSLLPALLDRQYEAPLRGPIIHHSASGHFAIRDGRWKLNLPQAGPELFDLSADLSEKRNVASENPAVVERLKATLTSIVQAGTDGARWWPQMTWIEPPNQQQ